MHNGLRAAVGFLTVKQMSCVRHARDKLRTPNRSFIMPFGSDSYPVSCRSLLLSTDCSQALVTQSIQHWHCPLLLHPELSSH